MAGQDAAFEACVNLYKAGLLNDNFLPLLLGKDVEEIQKDIEKRANILKCSPKYDPWPKVAQGWSNLKRIWVYLVTLDSNRHGSQPLEMQMVSSVELPQMDSIHLQWNEILTFNLTTSQLGCFTNAPDHTENCARITQVLLHSVFESRMSAKSTDFPLLFVPFPNTATRPWIDKMIGSRVIHREPPDLSEFGGSVGIIRARSMYGLARYIYQGFVFRSPRSVDGDHMDSEKLHFKLARFTKRTDFLHEIPQNNPLSPTKGDGITYIPVEDCQVANLPFKYSQFAAFVPSLMHHVEVHLVVQELCSKVLPNANIKDRSLIKTALSASVARESTNYQRLEFLGDSVLKFLTAINLTAENLQWHEGYLSRKKDHIVSNGRLSRAAKESGLDKYILTKPFSGYRWAPYYNHQILADDAPATLSRELSTKILADVVEALTGAAFLDGRAEDLEVEGGKGDGGEYKAIIVLETLLPDNNWGLSKNCTREITLMPYIRDSQVSQMPSAFEHIEALVGYSFKHKILALEALTYASYDGALPTPSYQRLEFLGDSVLDFVITQKIFDAKPDIPTPRMHLIRTALANANFLAYLCLTLDIKVPKSDVMEDEVARRFIAVQKLVSRSIWQHMRHTTSTVVQAQRLTLVRFEEHRESVKVALESGSRYPWLALTLLGADKFFSDLIESMLGAIFVDSAASIEACEAFLTRIGLVSYLERAIGESGAHIQFMHPKEWLGVLAVTEKVRYRELSQEEQVARGFEAGGVTYCVSLGERELAVKKGRNKVEAETMVAEAAVEVLRGEGRKESGMESVERNEEMIRDQLLEEEKEDMEGLRLVGA